MSRAVSVWHVTREYAGFAEAGGVKDVVRGLAEAHARAGGTPTVVMPLYGFMRREAAGQPPVAQFTFSLPDQDRQNAFFEEPVRVHAMGSDGVRLLLVDSPRYSALRDVYTYTAADEAENHWRKKGTGHWDSHQLNLILQRAALESALALGEVPDVFHCHDGHTSFLPALLREDARFAGPLRSSASVVTIHNAGKGYHQEVWDPSFAGLLTGLPAEVIEPGAAQRHGRSLSPGRQVCPPGDRLRAVRAGAAGRARAGDERRPWKGPAGAGHPPGRHHQRNRSITVGPPLSAEVRDPFPIRPVLGGPGRKEEVAPGSRGKGRRCRALLFPNPTGPLYAFVGRLTGQKGIDVLFHALEILVQGGGDRRFVVLGTGEKEKEAMLGWLAAQPGTGGRLVFLPRYDPALASLIYAASDFFLVPSTYEPCGLTDFIAQLMGSIPLVHHVGGLVKIRDGETGFSYREQNHAALAAAVERTSRLFAEEPRLLEAIRRRAFEEIFSLHTWDRVLADSYLPLYESAVAEGSWTRK